jgi:DNA-binding transcriptional LysR family regulator
LKNLDVGAVNLGASQTTGTYLIPKLVASFQKKYPGVKVQLTVDSTSSICTSVADGDIDVAIVGGVVPIDLMDYLQVTTYTEEEFVLILPPRHPLAMTKKGKRIAKEKLYNLAFVSLNQNSTSQKFQTQTLEDNGINSKYLHIQMEFNSIEAIKSAVQNGLGAAFVSQSAIQKEVQLGLLHSRSIKDVILTRKLQVVTNSKRYFSRAAQCFTQEILTAADWYGIQQSSEKSNRIYHK